MPQYGRYLAVRPDDGTVIDDAAYTKKNLRLYKHKKSIMKNKKSDKEKTTHPGYARSVVPNIRWFNKQCYTSHLYHINNTNDYRFQAIHQKNLCGIPSFVPHTIHRNQVYQYKKIIA